MHSAIEEMLSGYDMRSWEGSVNAARQVMQTVTLLGLEKSGFFRHASFMGGTALRIFHGLDRFSEDLDFCLSEADPRFAFDDYLKGIVSTMKAYGIEVSASEKTKSKVNSIRVASVKGPMREILLQFHAMDEQVRRTPVNMVMRIKLEIDVDPPGCIRTEKLLCPDPQGFFVNVQDMPTMFAGKLHAVLCRNWGNRDKGRDLYDFIFYVRRGVPVNREHLRSRLMRDGRLEEDSEFDEQMLRRMLKDRFAEIDFDAAALDVYPFVDDRSSLEGWSNELFSSFADLVRFERRNENTDAIHYVQVAASAWKRCERWQNWTIITSTPRSTAIPGPRSRSTSSTRRTRRP